MDLDFPDKCLEFPAAINDHSNTQQVSRVAEHFVSFFVYVRANCFLFKYNVCLEKGSETLVHLFVYRGIDIYIYQGG